MSWGSGSSGSGRGGTPPGDGGAADRLGQVRAWLAEGAARLRDRASQRWRERVEPDPLAEPAPAAWGSEPAAPGVPAPVRGHPRQGSLRSRLLWSFVGVAALAALIVGIVTLSLVRLASVNGLEEQLRDQAEVASTIGIGGGTPPCVTLAALRAVQTEMYLVASDGSPQPVTCRGFRAARLSGPVAPAPDVDLRVDLDGGAVRTGSRGSVVYAVAPLQQPVQDDLQGVRYDGVLLTHSLGGLGIGLVGGVAWRLLLATALAVAIAALGAGQLSTRVRVEGDDEVAEVGAAFNEMAADIEHSQGEQRAFLASVSHELKTPLTAVQGYTEALLDGTITDPPARHRTLERIHGETLRLARLVQDLIDLARLGRGQFAVSPVDADVTTVLGEAVAVAAERAVAQGVSVEQQVPDTPLLARVDPGRLRQVLDNLLDNATRSSPTGHPVLVAARPRAFDRGYLWSRYRGTRTVGSGLGLAIVKALCDAMGVTVRAESGRESGRGGTAFRLALPPARSSRPSWAASGHGLPTPR